MEAVKEMQRTISQDRGIGQKNQFSPCSLIASGGVSSLADLRSLAALGLEGAIVGKAIYTGDVDLAAAIQELAR